MASVIAERAELLQSELESQGVPFHLVKSSIRPIRIDVHLRESSSPQHIAEITELMGWDCTVIDFDEVARIVRVHFAQPTRRVVAVSTNRHAVAREFVGDGEASAFGLSMSMDGWHVRVFDLCAHRRIRHYEPRH